MNEYQKVLPEYLAAGELAKFSDYKEARIGAALKFLTRGIKTPPAGLARRFPPPVGRGAVPLGKLPEDFPRRAARARLRPKLIARGERVRAARKTQRAGARAEFIGRRRAARAAARPAHVVKPVGEAERITRGARRVGVRGARPARAEARARLERAGRLRAAPAPGITPGVAPGAAAAPTVAPGGVTFTTTTAARPGITAAPQVRAGARRRRPVSPPGLAGQPFVWPAIAGMAGLQLGTALGG